MGGVIAQDGFDYQIWQGLVRLPAWLRNPAFEALIFEGFEDIEARFFAPHVPERRLLERFQVKSGTLCPQDVKDVFERFHEFERTNPRVTRVHTLITPQLPASLRWVARDAARIRRARPFYAPFSALLAASDSKFLDDLAEIFGEPLGGFVAAWVEAVEHSIHSRDLAFHAFSAAFAGAFPTIDIGSRRMDVIFSALVSLVHNSTGVALSRRRLIETIESVGSMSLAMPSAVPIHIRSDRNESKEDVLEVDASTFSGGVQQFPKAHIWETNLITPLGATADWLRMNGISRVALSGSYRLSTAFLLGWSFRSAHGFEMEVPTREDVWRTDDRPSSGDHDGWIFCAPRALLRGRRLVVSVGIIRRPSVDLVANSIDPMSILDCFLELPITSGKEVQIGVARIKKAVDDSASRLRPTAIDLYIAGPAAFAVALGHRWNGLPRTRLHEFDPNKRAYVQIMTCG